MSSIKSTLSVAAAVVAASACLALTGGQGDPAAAAAARELKTGTVTVPGATIHYERRGEGPTLLLIPGGPQDAGVFSDLAGALEARFTVVAIDPRCNSRSRCDDMTSALDVGLLADDAAAVIEMIGNGPAFVFGTRGGAQIGLDLAARHPGHVRRLVAHEPPALLLLADPSKALADEEKIHAAYEAGGAEAAFMAFLEVSGMGAEPEGEAPPQSPEDEETFGRIMGNMDYFFAHGMRPLSEYGPDVEALSAMPGKVMVGLGATSEGSTAHATGLALAGRLGVEPVIFPGDHVGYTNDAANFAGVLEAALGL